MKRSFLCSFLILLACSISIAQALDSTTWVTDGQVSAMVRYGNTLYLGGYFNMIGPHTGSGATLSTLDGKTTATPLLRINGIVNETVADGKGGWFIGGTFTQIQGREQKYLAHILANGTLDGAWNPRPDDRVTTLAIKDNVLYASGRFSTIGGKARRHLAALDAVTGQATAWNADADDLISEFAMSGNTLYVGGAFSSIRGQIRKGLAALDAATGQVLAWDPFANAEPTVNHVTAMALSGGVVYVGGDFYQIGGTIRLGLAALDATTGQATAWNPYAGSQRNSSRRFNAMLVAGNTVYVGGFFSTVGRDGRRNIAALDATTGRLLPWNPGSNNSVYALALAGNVLYVGGDFTAIGGTERYNLAALDATTGQVTGWYPPTNSYVTTLAVAGNVVFVGGWFSSTSGQIRKGLAALDATTGQPTAWNPNVAGNVQAIVVSENVVYAGGRFTAAGGQARANLAALDAITGQATAWRPTTNNAVFALALVGNVMYIGGSFNNINDPVRPFLGAVDATTGQVTNWEPACNGIVKAIAATGDVVYAGGYFTNIGGENRLNLAALDAVKGRTTPRKVDADDMVNALILANNTLYVGGSFNSVGGQSRNRLAALDAATGLVTGWNPDAGGGYTFVSALAASGSEVYVGGGFTTVGGQSRRSVAALDAVTGQVTAWNPGGGTDFSGVSALAVSGSTVYAGGGFTQVNNKDQPYLAAFGRTANRFNYIKGTVFEDTNGDCLQNAGERGLANRVLVARPGNYFTSTDSAGRYALAVDTGTYTLEHVIPADKQHSIRQTCPAGPSTYSVRFTGAGQTLDGKNFANQLRLVPHLEVGVSSSRRRRCFASTTTVSYANTGIAPAAGAKMYVQLPPYVVLKSAGAPFTRDKDGHYVFDLGTLAPDARGSIVLQDSVACGNPDIRGLTQCTRAWITPANPTTPGDGWDRSDAVLKAACGNNGRLRLALYNHGAGSMADSSALRIYLDAQLAFAGRYKLAQGDSLILQVPANGRTVRLEADQRPGHPTRRQSHITLEACGTNGSGTVSKGFVAQLPCEDPEPETAVECLPIIDSFDPNDKAVSPQGAGPERYTPTGAALHYVIRFQNTGTDVAYRVVVADTLSEHLDVSTLRVETVSHPYRMTVTGKGRPVLTFTFDNINLPDSTADEPRSHGRIGFSIQPKAGLPEKTRVENFADIFFDYNEPIRTNITRNVLYDVPPVVVEAVRLDPAAICASTNGPTGAGSDQTVCGQVAGAVLGAAAPAQGKGRWKRVSGTGVVQDAENPASAVTGLGYGANVFEWSVPANACGSDSLKAQVTVTRLPKPATPGISRQGTDSLVCSLPGTDYEWSLDGEQLTPSARAIAASRAGGYRVRVKDARGCWSDESAAFLYAITGMAPAVTPTLRVYPNPTRGMVTLQLPAGSGTPVQLSVYDALGRQLWGRNLPAGAEKTDVDLSGCAAGLYLIKLKTPNGITVRRVLRMD